MNIIRLKKILKPLGIVVILGLLLFFLIDNILMPIYVQTGKTTRVPDVIGLALSEAKIKVHEAGLEPKESEYKTDKRYEIGTVIQQSPLPESEVKFGRGVYLTISGGEELVEVPNLKGKSLRDAAFNLERCGLRLGIVSYEPSEEIFANTIIRQEISPNAKVRSGNYINVTVSQGRLTDKHSMPDVTSKTLTEAEKIIIDGGFQIGKVSYQVNLDLLPNTVLEQNPPAGEIVHLGQIIDLIVAKNVEETNDGK